MDPPTFGKNYGFKLERGGDGKLSLVLGTLQTQRIGFNPHETSDSEINEGIGEFK